MKTTFLILCCVFIVSMGSNAQNVGDSPQTKIGFTQKLKSTYLNDSVKFFIHHPYKYQPDKEYPLILLLDGNSTFKAFSACTELMGYDRSIPPCVLVGFPQYQYADFNSENLESKMDKLIQFMEKEMLPYLHSKHNITETLIWGQGGQSGLICNYIMLEKPDMFNGYISDVPDFSLIKDKVVSKNAFNNIKNENRYYYLLGSSAEHVYNEQFVRNLKTNAPKELKWSYHLNAEPNMISYFIGNYMKAIELFFNKD